MDKKQATQQRRAIKKMEDGYLMCRDIRHQWSLGVVTKGVTISTGDTVMTRTLNCDRCGAKRHDTYMAKTFARVATNYEYPEGYLLTVGRLDGGMVRKEFFARA